MNYLKYTPYIYLIFGLVFIIDGIKKWNDTKTGPWLSLMIAGVAVFMFFFRKKYAKKMMERNKEK